MAAELPLFTLPPAPDEAAAARYAAAEAEASRRAVREPAAKAWRAVPATHQAQTPDLLRRCCPGLRDPLIALGQNATAGATLAALLMGPSGTGKSTAAAVLVRRAISVYVSTNGEACREVVDLVWTTATELALAERRHPLGAGAPDLVVQAMRAGALVLDDVGLEAAGATAIFAVLSHRYDACLPTIVTTGLQRQELTAHLSAAGVRRVVDQHAPGHRPLVLDVFPGKRK